MQLQYHGIQSNNATGAGELHFGFLKLLHVISELATSPFTEPDNRLRWPYKRIDRKFHFAINKLHYTYFSYQRLSRHIAKINSECKSQPQGLLDSLNDLPLYLDLAALYIRMQADCVANLVPYFYEENNGLTIPSKSFRDQQKWFIRRRPEFDSVYTKILINNTGWFEKLAGKFEEEKNKGYRDLIVHYRAVHQPYFDESGNLKAALINDSGCSVEDMLLCLKETLVGFFGYLDEIYMHFMDKIYKDSKNEFFNKEKRNSCMLRFDEGCSSAFWIYPVLGNKTVVS